MSAFAPSVIRATPRADIRQIAYSDINAAEYVNGDVRVYNTLGGLLGCASGTTYGTVSGVVIPMAIANWASLWVGVYIEAKFNQNITCDVHALYGYGNISGAAFGARDLRGKLASFIIPQTDYFRFSLADAVVGEGGVVGTSTAAIEAIYRMSAGMACPYIGLQFTGGGTPSAGKFFAFNISRTS
jgi:hypothetical protein